MAEVIFTVANAKDANLAEETKEAEEQGVSVDSKKGVLTVKADTTDDVTIDISSTTLFKTVNVASGYEGSLNVIGNPNVANAFVAGPGGAVFDGGEATTNAQNKLVTSADKFTLGAGSDTVYYGINGGKDNVYSYANDGEDNVDVIMLPVLTETQKLSFVDKSGGLTVTISDSEDATVAKNSVLTIDGKTKVTTNGFNGFILQDADGGETVYGALKEGTAAYATKNGKDDTSTITLGSGASGTINVGLLSSTAKNINGTEASKAVYIVGNANANNISIGSSGGTIDGGTGASKATNDNLYGTTGTAPVTFVYQGGKDVVYNYKTNDDLVIGGDYAATNNGADVLVTVGGDKNNVITLKNVLGQAIAINGDVDDEISHTLPTALVYDAKMAKITADASKLQPEFVMTGKPSLNSSTGNWEVPGYTVPAATITLGSGFDAFVDDASDVTIEASVTEIDLSASTAPVVIGTDTGEDSKIANVKVGSAGSTVVGSTAVVQTFTGGAGNDIFVIDSSKIEVNESNGKQSTKADTFNNIGEGDTISIGGATADNLLFEEKGKALNIVLANEDATVTVATIANFDSSTGITVLGDPIGEGSAAKPYSKKFPIINDIAGLDYLVKGSKTDKTALVADGSFTGKETKNVIDAKEYGGSTIKNIDATAVTKASSLVITGSSNANNLFAPTEGNINTTLDGTTGNDNLYSGKGATTFVFKAQATKGKKDIIYDYKDGDLIVIDTSLISDDEKNGVPTLEKDADGASSLIYTIGEKTTNGFNDSKADVVISLNKANTITVKNGAGKAIRIAELDSEGKIVTDENEKDVIYTFGHVPDPNLKYDAKNTTLTLAGGGSFEGTIDLSKYSTYYSTTKKVDLTGNAVAAAISGNSLANELIAGEGGSTLYGGAGFNSGTDDKPKLVVTADKLTGSNGADYFQYNVGDGKDQFLNFGAVDVVSIGNAYGDVQLSDLTFTDKKNVLTVAITGDAIETDKTKKAATNTAANSTFSITKQADGTPIKFVLARGEDESPVEFTYNAALDGVSIDSKYATLDVSTGVANQVVNAGIINSQPKIIDGRKSTAAIALIGNGNADAIYAPSSSGSTLFGGTAGTKAVKDQLYGGSGKDVFVFTSQDGEKGKETDIVYNYNYADGDVIVLDKEPNLVKSDGKILTLTWNDDVEVGTKTSKVASTLVINGVNNDNGGMKKFDPISGATPVTFAIGSIYNEAGELDLSAALANQTSYTFNNAVEGSTLKSGKASWGEDAGMEEYPPSAQLASNVSDYWFTEDAATTDVVSSELDDILDIKGATSSSAQFNADSYFTGVGETDQSAATAAAFAARHRAQK